MSDLFGGIILADAYFPALRRVCVAFNLFDEASTNQSYHAVEVVAENHDPNDPRRIWWHSQHSDGYETWISVNPGEFRTKAPEPPCIIREMPIGSPKRSLRETLQCAVHSCEVLQPFSVDEKQTLSHAKALLSRTSKGLPRDFCTTIRSDLKSMDQSAYQVFVNKLYEEYFFSFRCMTVDFAPGILLFQLQHLLGAKIEQDWTEKPVEFLGSYIRLLLNDATRREQTFEKLIDVCRTEFRSGRDLIANGLDGSMGALTDRLMLAYHHFFNALALLNCLVDAGISRTRLPVDPVVAEEAAACTSTGIHAGADFFTEDPDAYLLRVRIDHGPSLKSFNRKIRKEASEIQPRFTRFFAKILAAQALTQSDRSAEVVNGIEELTRLSEDCGPDFAFEESWIDHALLNGYRRTGDAEAAKRVAFKVGSKLVMRKVLGRAVTR